MCASPKSVIFYRPPFYIADYFVANGNISVLGSNISIITAAAAAAATTGAVAKT